ncbi:MAG: hypothetical protein ACRYGA_10340 [Janthinobacterium lividum]
MHSAPAVSFAAGRPRIVSQAVFVLWAAGLACGLASVGSGEIWRASLLIGVSMVAGTVVLQHVRRASSGTLRFDGRQWSVSGANPVRWGHLQVCLDGQSLMLLRLAAAGRKPRWLWVESRTDAQAWHDLRRAVYSRAPVAANSGEPDSAPSAGSRHSALR